MNFSSSFLYGKEVLSAIHFLDIFLLEKGDGNHISHISRASVERNANG